jgi:acetylornithine deacetylase/succinyl-diaminopimelate desuccinylase-like protein
MSLATFQHWTRAHQSQIRNDYFRFLRFRTISADPALRLEMARCADWLVELLEGIGFTARSIDTPGCPLVYAENLEAGSEAATLLIYGHYDVQPVDPVELWNSDPFEPTERDGKVYARGALDDKGQILYAILAMRAWKEQGLKLPINVKFCIEGEEESSSAGLAQVMGSLEELLRADYLMIADFDLFDKKTPTVTLGARGIMTMEVTLTGSASDLHSGMLGGVAYNPNRALVELLAQFWDADGRVAIPHFYDEVEELSEAERARYSSTQDREFFRREFGIEAFGGEKGYKPHEALWLRPTIEINGISGGYNGAGFKTVIPAKATAKISCRLVPNQDPARIEQLVKEFLLARVKPGMKMELRSHGGGAAFRGDPRSLLAAALSETYEEIMGVACRATLAGGSIPIIADLSRISGAQVVGMGYGLPDDNIHAPNERFDLVRLEQGIWTVARTIERIGARRHAAKS